MEDLVGGESEGLQSTKLGILLNSLLPSGVLSLNLFVITILCIFQFSANWRSFFVTFWPLLGYLPFFYIFSMGERFFIS